MEAAHATTTRLHELLTTFHSVSKGTINALGPLLGDLGPAAMQGKPLSKGMANALLHNNAKAGSYELAQLIALFDTYLSTEDTPTLIAPILNKHISLASTGGAAIDSIDTGTRTATNCSLVPRAQWCTRTELDTLKDSNDPRGRQAADLVHIMFPNKMATDADAAACQAET